MRPAKTNQAAVRFAVILSVCVFNTAAAESPRVASQDSKHSRVSMDDGPPCPPAQTESAAPGDSDANPQGDAVESWIADTLSAELQPIRRKRSPKTEPASEQEPSAGSAALGSGGGAIEMLWPLFVVLGLIVLAAIVFKRFVPGARRFNGAGAIEVLARQYLSNKHSLCLVRVGRRLVLLGVTPERIGRLCEISDAEEQSAIATSIQRGRPDSFTATFQQWADQMEPGDVDDDAEGNISFDEVVRARQTVRGLTQRVRSMRTHADSLRETA